MDVIRFDRWKVSDNDPHEMEYVGQRSAQEVFAELSARLEGMGFLPDEYFLLASEWENGELIPQGSDYFSTTDYGGSEGIYIDGYLKWVENGKSVTKIVFCWQNAWNDGLGPRPYVLDLIGYHQSVPRLRRAIRTL